MSHPALRPKPDSRSLDLRRLKRGLNVEHPIARDELRAIKRYMASRTDALPGCSSPNVGNRSRVNL
jgi:hypothetical protein